MLSSSPTALLLTQPNAGEEAFVRDRRIGLSNGEAASLMLLHAIAYLIAEQREGKRLSVSANREAIQILCAAGRNMASYERRKPARLSLLGWLRSCAYRPQPE